MTINQALAQARRRFGKAASVKKTPSGAFVGLHGEFVKAHFVVREHTGVHRNARAGQYYCHACSQAEGGDARVYHLPGAPQTAYAVGYVGLGIFFCVEGEGDSWRAAFDDADRRTAAHAAEFKAIKAKGGAR